MEELKKIEEKFKLKEEEIISISKVLEEERYKRDIVEKELNKLKGAHQELQQKFNKAKKAFNEVQ